MIDRACVTVNSGKWSNSEAVCHLACPCGHCYLVHSVRYGQLVVKTWWEEERMGKFLLQGVELWLTAE